MKRDRLYLILTLALLLLAVLVALYPLISNLYAEKHASEIRTEYFEKLAVLDSGYLLEERERAENYNRLLAEGISQSFSDEQLTTAYTDYNSILNVNGDGIMGYVEIPLLDINLPIYHGTDADTLERGIGHVIGSSLPVGGESSHAAISGHSGMASEKMFSDLDKLKTGDVFYIRCLGDTLAYEVDSINTVLPTEAELLEIEQGEDSVTLITCTPFGVNTHRLLVRGSRIAYEEILDAEFELLANTEPVKSTWMEKYIKGLATGTSVLLAGLASVYGAKRLRGRLHGKKN